jgi:hypothetical protein
MSLTMIVLLCFVFSLILMFLNWVRVAVGAFRKEDGLLIFIFFCRAQFCLVAAALFGALFLALKSGYLRI